MVSRAVLKTVAPQGVQGSSRLSIRSATVYAPKPLKFQRFAKTPYFYATFFINIQLNLISIHSSFNAEGCPNGKEPDLKSGEA